MGVAAPMRRIPFFLLLFTVLWGCAGTQPETDIGVEPQLSEELAHASEAMRQQTLSGRELSRYLLEHTVTLRANDAQGREIGLGSGFFLPGDRVVTNAHVIAGAAWIDVESVTGELLGTAAYAVGLDIDADLAVLRITGAGRVGLVLAAEPPAVGDDVLVAGAPLGLEGSVSRGIVSAYRDKRGQRMMQITAPISSGSSGGPVVNEAGELVGVVTEMIPAGQNLNFAVPVDALRELAIAADGRHIFPPADTFPEDDRIDAAELVNVLLAFAMAPLLEQGQTISGRLDRDSVHLEGSPIAVYRLEGQANSTIQIDVMSSEIDMMAELLSEDIFTDGADVWSVSDDDGGQGTDARILTVLPRTGSYYLVVQSYDDSYGRFRISSQEPPRSGVRRGDRWQLVDITSDNTHLYIDTETTQRQFGNATTWIRIEPPHPASSEHGAYDTALICYEYDCRGSRHRVRTFSYYYEGSPLHTVEVPGFLAIWESVIPGTVAETIMREACRPQ